MEKLLRTTNETDFLAHINLSVSSACLNALCSANDATNAETAAVWRLSNYANIYYIYNERGLKWLYVMKNVRDLRVDRRST